MYFRQYMSFPTVPLLDAGRLPLVPLLKYGPYEQLLDKRTGAPLGLPHPEQMAMLKQRPELIKNAVEEFLRYRGPLMLATRRWAREDLEFDGKLIQRGESGDHTKNGYVLRAHKLCRLVRI
ncbi:hypothetical protein ccbrp13_46870 [Ktedonobacteria bacterium brp13]|nr:hypothetical protein ccbrp13_46870 [Ktedonobacteria bacterium brp13]